MEEFHTKEEKELPNKVAGLPSNKVWEFKSSEIISSTKSQTFSEIEKQYNNLIEQALDISISNKDFSRISSMRTAHLGNIPGKFGSERTNTIFHNEFNYQNDKKKMYHKESQNNFRARVSPILGY
jgi:predicted AlkP superfamily phosphohydrolase/phosphomutase